jgi:hypothetical protein
LCVPVHGPVQSARLADRDDACALRAVSYESSRRGGSPRKAVASAYMELVATQLGTANADSSTQPVSADPLLHFQGAPGVPSWNRSILTEIYLCPACSCQ